MKRRHWKVALSAAASVAAALGLLVVQSLSSSALPAPAPLTGAWPAASPPAGMTLVHLPTGVVERNAAAAYRGGSYFDKRDFAISAALVRHPQGDLLIDTGFGRELATQIQLMPFWFRAITHYRLGRSAAQQLTAAGYDRKHLRAVVLTHAHWDHASGVPDFSETPIWVTTQERRFIAEGGWRSAVARSCKNAHYHTYGFPGGPYLGFARSYDVYGDGSVVIVPAAGHTPGSVIVFVSLPDARRYAFIGDLAWQQEGVSLREEKPLFSRAPADSDAGLVREGLLRMAAITARFPELIVVPAHDMRGFASMSGL